MEISILLNSAISIGASIGLFFLLKYFIPKYFEKKAENLATKEDIGEITTIVESIKQQNSKELELIKSELSVKTKAQQAIYDDEREAIIEYLMVALELKITHLTIPKIFLSQESLNDYVKQIDILESFHNKFLLQSAKMKLFCFDDELIIELEIIEKIINTLTARTLQSRRIIYDHFNHCFKLSQLTTKDSIKEFEAKKHEILKLRADYYDNTLKIRTNFNISYEKFQLKCKQYLKAKHNFN